MGVIYKNSIRYAGGGGSDVPTPTTADIGKVLAVGDDLKTEWVEGGGGTTGNYLDKVNPVGTGSLQLGINCVASGNNAAALGNSTTASGDASHTEGGGTLSSEFASHAEGSGTKSLGDSAHAEGGGTIAIGNYSHAEGGGTTAIGNYSHAGGVHTIAMCVNETAIGKYNATSAPVAGCNTLLSIGNGDSTTRKNVAFIDERNNVILGNNTSVVLNPTTSVQGNKIIGEGNSTSGDIAYQVTIGQLNNYRNSDTGSLGVNDTILGSQNNITIDNISYGAYSNHIIGTHIHYQTTSGRHVYNTILGRGSTVVSNGTTSDSVENVRFDSNIIGGADNKITNSAAATSVIFGGANLVTNSTLDKSVVTGWSHNLLNMRAGGLTVEGAFNAIGPASDIEHLHVYAYGPFSGTHIEGSGNGISYTPSPYDSQKYDTIHLEGANNLIFTTTDSHTSGMHIEGTINRIYGGDQNLHVEGYETSVYVGNGSLVQSHIEAYDGNIVVNNGTALHVEGYGPDINVTGWTGVHVEGYRPIVKNGATVSGGHIEGWQTSACNNASLFGTHIEGYSTLIGNGGTAYGSHIEGYDNIIGMGASVNGAHVEGHSNRIMNPAGNGVHVEGCGTTVSSQAGATAGYAVHAEGYGHLVTGQAAEAHIGGTMSTVTQHGSFIHGKYLVDSAEYQTIFGEGVGNSSTSDIGTPSTSRQFAIISKHDVEEEVEGEATTVTKPFEAFAIDKETGELWFTHNGKQYNLGQILDALLEATSADSGKVLGIDANGKLTLITT